MPISNGKYVAPNWVNGSSPAINATELNAICQTLEKVPDTYTTPGSIGNLHLWKEYKMDVYSTAANVQCSKATTSSSVTPYYNTCYDDVYVDESGNLVGKGKHDLTISYDQYEGANEARGKFLYDSYNDIFYYILPDSTATRSYDSDRYKVYISGKRVKGGSSVSYPTSTNRNDYPDVPDSSATQYTYLGMIGGHAWAQVLSYVGTGTYGDGNPCSLTADFPIKMAMIIGYRSSYEDETKDTIMMYSSESSASHVMLGDVLSDAYTANNGFTYGKYAYKNSYGKKSNGGKTISWYHTKDAKYQVNESGYTYYFLAVG